MADDTAPTIDELLREYLLFSQREVVTHQYARSVQAIENIQRVQEWQWLEGWSNEMVIALAATHVELENWEEKGINASRAGDRVDFGMAIATVWPIRWLRKRHMRRLFWFIPVYEMSEDDYLRMLTDYYLLFLALDRAWNEAEEEAVEEVEEAG